jgi:hypothetical protein
VCGSTTYERCEASFDLIVSMVPGELVAVCEYSGGTGDIVLLETPADATTSARPAG